MTKLYIYSQNPLVEHVRLFIVFPIIMLIVANGVEILFEGHGLSFTKMVLVIVLTEVYQMYRLW